MLSFRDIDVEGDDDVNHLVKWSNDPSIRHLYQRFTSKQQYERPLEVGFAKSGLRNSMARGRSMYMIQWHDQVVGEVSLEMSSPAVVPANPGTGWVGIVLGESRVWGRGIGKAAMHHIEEVARRKGAKRIQLGVFDFNTRAKKLYQSLGYVHLYSTPAFTWWDDQMWTDLRLGKSLIPPGETSNARS